MMGTLTVSEQKSGHTLLLHFAGDLSESTALAQLELEGIEELRIDLAELGYVNSAGLAAWIFWTRSVESQAPRVVIIENMTSIFLRIMLSVKDIVPPRWKIVSAFATYYCGACNLSTERRIGSVRDLVVNAQNGPAGLSHYQCSSCSQLAELDGTFSRYLEVFRKYG